MPRAERRDQIVRAATRAFAEAGYVSTGLDDVARQAGVSRVILYRHFDSKGDLYRAVLDRVCGRLLDATGDRDFGSTSLPSLLAVAAEDPDGFRLLFHHAIREPELRDEMSAFRDGMVAVAEEALGDRVPEGPWRSWAAQLTAHVPIDAVIAWLDAGCPDPEPAADRIQRLVDAIVEAAGSSGR